MKGLNTDINPRRLPEGVHSEFTQMTYASGVLKPRNADESFTAPTTGFEGFIYTNLTTKSAQQVDFGEDYGALIAHVPLAGGTAEIRNSGGTYEEDLTLALPSFVLGIDMEDDLQDDGSPNGTLSDGDSMTFAYGWKTADTLAPTKFSLSTPFTITLDTWVHASIGAKTGTAPTYGLEVTGSTSGATGYVRLFKDSTFIFIDQTSTTNFSASETLTWSGGSVASSSSFVALTGFTPKIQIASLSAPTDADSWVLYALDTDGVWREIYTVDAATDYCWVNKEDVEFFPYTNADQTILFTAYPGPVDDNGLVETLVALSSSCSIMTAIPLFRKRPQARRWGNHSGDCLKRRLPGSLHGRGPKAAGRRLSEPLFPGNRHYRQRPESQGRCCKSWRNLCLCVGHKRTGRLFVRRRAVARPYPRRQSNVAKKHHAGQRGKCCPWSECKHPLHL